MTSSESKEESRSDQIYMICNRKLADEKCVRYKNYTVKTGDIYIEIRYFQGTQKIKDLLKS